MKRAIVLCLFAVATVAAADFPSVAISNGQIRARIMLPDAERGYYRGTRFDWSGQIESLEYNGHNYFGQWFPKYDPKLHDAIMGPVEEFRTNLARRLPQSRQKAILDLCMDAERLARTPVNEFVDLFVV